MTTRLPIKGTLESVVLGFDFTAEAASVTLVSVTCDFEAGFCPDPNPTAVLDGAAQSDSTNPAGILQRVQGGLDATSYLIQCTVQTDAGDTLTLGAILPVSVNP